MTFPTYDAATDSIRLNGGATLMLTLLMKARFGEPFDPEIIFHKDVTSLIRQLDAASGAGPPEPGVCFQSFEEMRTIAEKVYDESFQNGWWALSASERVEFLQDAVAPWVLSDSQVDFILSDVESRLFHARRITSVAAAAGEP